MMKRRIWGIWLLMSLLVGCRSGEKGIPPKVTYEQARQGAEIASWETELPADIILVLDQSGSMGRGRYPTDPNGLRVQGSLAFLEFIASRATQQKPNRFGVVNFGTDAPRQYAVPLTPVRSLDDPNLRKVKDGLVLLNLGDTSFIRALTLAVQLLREAKSLEQLRNRAIVVFTDGEPDDPRKLPLSQYFAELDQFVQQVIKPNKITLFIVGIDAYGKRWSKTVSYWQKFLGEANVLTIPNLEALKDYFNQIVQRIWNLPEVPPDFVEADKRKTFEVGPYLAALEFYIFPTQKNATLRVYRPDGRLVNPGTDPDSPPIKRGTAFSRLVVLDPQPGSWQYEAVGGRVEVVRNHIPIRLRLISPAIVHPAGKPLRLIVEFKRTDGKPIVSDPNYPLGLSADLITPTGQRYQILFPLERGQNGIYEGQPEIENTMTVGEYSILLKMRGGEKFQYQRLVRFQVLKIPYLLVEEPNPLTPITPAEVIFVRAKLLELGKPCRPQDAFTNHPDQLVIAQVQDAKGSKAQAVWIPLSKEGGKVGEFEGMVPVPGGQEGSYTLTVRLSPEEPEKQKLADATVVRFEMRYPPIPLWRHPLSWITLLVLFAVLFMGRHWWISAPPLFIYYWTHDIPRYRSIASRKRDEKFTLSELGIEIHRLGKGQRVLIRPKSNVRLMVDQERQVTDVEISAGSGRQFLVEANNVQRALVVTVGQLPTSQPKHPSEEKEGEGRGEDFFPQEQTPPEGEKEEPKWSFE
ncbi:MAG: vWA domain-containing protein [Nitrososphaerota archaeon]